jgi:hypothetical protein
MNHLPKQTSGPPRGSNPRPASEITNFFTTDKTTPPPAPVIEAEIKRRADTMTAVLAKIMDRPESIRHWGLNE